MLEVKILPGTQPATVVISTATKGDAGPPGPAGTGGTTWCGPADGTSSAIILAPATPITEHTVGAGFRFVASWHMGAEPTIQISGLAPLPLKKWGGRSVMPGDILSSRMYEAVYDGNDQYILANPSTHALAASMTIGDTIFHGLSLDQAAGDLIDVYGTDPLEYITLNVGDRKTVRFMDATTIVSGAIQLLNSGENMSVEPGDIAEFGCVSGGTASMLSFSPFIRPAVILSGSGAPDDELGIQGDFYLDKAGPALYGPKASGAGAWGDPMYMSATPL